MTPKRLALIILCFLLNSAPTFSEESCTIGAYFESWSKFSEEEGGRQPFSIEKIDESLLTDLYYAFAVFGYEANSQKSPESRLTHDFLIHPLYSDDEETVYPQLAELKKRSGGKLRLILSVGGASFNDPNDLYEMGQYTYPLFSRMVSSPASRDEFIQSAISYARRFGFDGIDIDWEYPGDRTRGGSDADFENFLLFLQECSQAFHQADPPLILSFALPPSVPEGVWTFFKENPRLYYKWAGACSRFTDRITLMAYNYHTPFGEDKITGVNAPLLRDTNPSSDLYIAKTLDNYISNGVSSEKLLLGIPLYGWLYRNVSSMTADDTSPGKPFDRENNQSSDLLPYYLIADKIAEGKLNFSVDNTTSTAYCYNLNHKKWVSFDSPDTVALKAQLAKQRKLGGVVFWALNQDEYQWEAAFPNIRKAVKELSHRKDEVKDGDSQHYR